MRDTSKTLKTDMTAEAISNYCLDNMISLGERDSILDDYHLARLLAVHIVGEVLDEAYIVANAQESGESWQYLSLLKHFRNSKMDKDTSEVEDKNIYEIDENTAEENVESETNTETNAENVVDTIDYANIVVTSTPQRVIVEETVKSKPEVMLIGQGDEELEQKDMSTGTLINQLFDMSHEFEDLYIQNIAQEESENKEVVNDAMAHILDSYFNKAVNTVLYTDEATNPMENFIDNSDQKDEEYTDYTFLADYYGGTDIHKNMVHYIDDQIKKLLTDDIEQDTDQPGVIVEEITDNEIITEEENNALNIMNANVDAYLSLNRDYEQYSEEELGDQKKYDPKSFTDVDLISTHVEPTKPESPVFKQQEIKTAELASQSMVTASGSSRKSLVQRCRVHGSRLLACLRGWWRRRTPSNRKVSRVPSISRGYLSPNYRRRGLSLQNQRGERDQAPGEPVVWKFNTVNEALVNSTHWNDYTFDTQPGQCGEADVLDEKNNA